MSRVANAPVVVPSGVEIKLSGQDLAVKGSKGELTLGVHDDVEVSQEESALVYKSRHHSVPSLSPARAR